MTHHDEEGVVGRRIDDSGDAPDATSDPYDLKRRFCETHKRDYPTALREIKRGRKSSCWSWYIFPSAPWVVNGEERGSGKNKIFALRDKPPNTLRGDKAARAYLRYQASGVNLRA